MPRRLGGAKASPGSERTVLVEPARIAGKHGADHNLPVLSRRRAPHRAGHECRASILPNMAFVHISSATRYRPSRYQAACSYVPAAVCR
jgi:hypothetical protein